MSASSASPFSSASSRSHEARSRKVSPGDVLVVALSADNTDGMFGDLLATSLKARGGLGISKGSKNPDLAWDFLKFVTNEGAQELGVNRKLVTGNVAVDTKNLANLEKSDPIVHSILKTQLEHTDKMVGNWRLGNDSKVKEAFWPELQNVLLGRKDAKSALGEAERKVARELKRG